MDSFSALKNNSFGDFNKEDVLGFIDKMTRRTKKAELVLKDRVDVLNREREHLTVKISAFEKIISNLEQHLAAEKENVHAALVEKDELRKKIGVERDQFDSVLARRQKELADSEREILQFVAERTALNAQLNELETKSRRYDEIKANVNAIRLDAETDTMETAAETQGQVIEAVHIIDGIAEEVESMKQRFGQSRRDHIETVPPVSRPDPSPVPVPADPSVPSTVTADPGPIFADNESAPTVTESTPTEESPVSIGRESFPIDDTVMSEPAAAITEPVSPERIPQPVSTSKQAEPRAGDSGDDPAERLHALYKALDESMERLQDIKTQFIKNAGVPTDGGQ